MVLSTYCEGADGETSMSSESFICGTVPEKATKSISIDDCCNDKGHPLVANVQESLNGVAALPLKGVVVYVEVRAGIDNRSEAFRLQLSRLGAVNRSKFTVDVTHVVFREGTKSTMDKARSRPRVHLVSPQWVDGCKQSNSRVCEDPYRIANDSNSAKRVMRKCKSMQSRSFEEEVAISGAKEKRKRKREAMARREFKDFTKDLELDSTLLLPLYIPSTPPSMQKKLLAMGPFSPTPKLDLNKGAEEDGVHGDGGTCSAAAEASSANEHVKADGSTTLNADADANANANADANANEHVKADGSTTLKESTTPCASSMINESPVCTHDMKTPERTDSPDWTVHTDDESDQTFRIPEREGGLPQSPPLHPSKLSQPFPMSPLLIGSGSRVCSRNGDRSGASRTTPQFSRQPPMKMRKLLNPERSILGDMDSLLNSPSPTQKPASARKSPSTLFSSKKLSTVCETSPTSPNRKRKRNASPVRNPRHSIRGSNKASPRLGSNQLLLSPTVKTPRKLARSRSILARAEKSIFSPQNQTKLVTSLTEDTEVVIGVSSEISPSGILEGGQGKLGDAEASRSAGSLAESFHTTESALKQPRVRITVDDEQSVALRGSSKPTSPSNRSSDSRGVDPIRDPEMDCDSMDWFSLQSQSSTTTTQPAPKHIPTPNSSLLCTDDTKNLSKARLSTNATAYQHGSSDQFPEVAVKEGALTSLVTPSSVASTHSLFGSPFSHTKKSQASGGSICLKAEKADVSPLSKLNSLLHVDDPNRKSSLDSFTPKSQKTLTFFWGSKSHDSDYSGKSKNSFLTPSKVKKSGSKLKTHTSAANVKPKRAGKTTIRQAPIRKKLHQNSAEVAHNSVDDSSCMSNCSSKKSQPVGQPPDHVSIAQSQPSQGEAPKSLSQSSEESRSSRLSVSSKGSSARSGRWSSKDRPNIVLTSLSLSDQRRVHRVVKKLGRFDVVERVNELTTHVICGSDRRTMNFLCGKAQNCFLMSIGWVDASARGLGWLDEKEELFFPGTGSRRMAESTLLSKDTIIFVSKDTTPAKSELEQLASLCGAQVTQTVRKATLIIGKSGFKNGTSCVSPKWLLDCVTQWDLLPYSKFNE